MLSIGRDPCKNIHLNELLEGEDVVDSFLHPSAIAPQILRNPGLMMQGSPVTLYETGIVAQNIASPTSQIATTKGTATQDQDKKKVCLLYSCSVKEKYL